MFQLPGIANADSLLNPDTMPVAEPETGSDQRLGRYFENLVAGCVRASPNLELVARNIQVAGEHRTLGELDMLVRDIERRVLMHWEITVKFYLGLAPEYWPGPDPRDHFQRRASRLCEHQFPMLRRPECLALLAEQGWHVDEQYLFSRGRLFYPAHYRLLPPGYAHPRHCRGTWWHTAQLQQTNANWSPLEKSGWLTEDTMSDNHHDWLASDQMIDYVESAGRPVMALRQIPAASSQPDFIVPQQWLNHARQEQPTARPDC